MSSLTEELQRYDVVLKNCQQFALTVKHAVDCPSCDTFARVIADGRGVRSCSAAGQGDQAMMLCRPMQDSMVLAAFLTLHPNSVQAFRDHRRMSFSLVRIQDGSRDPALSAVITQLRGSYGWCFGVENGWTLRFLTSTRACPHTALKPVHPDKPCNKVNMAELAKEIGGRQPGIGAILPQNARRASRKIHPSPLSIGISGLSGSGAVAPLAWAASILAFASWEVWEFHGQSESAGLIADSISDAAESIDVDP